MNSRDDFDRHVADLMAVDREAAAIATPAITIMEADLDNERPNAAERRRLSEAAKAADKAPGHYLTLVTESALARGVVTAVAWLTGPTPRRKYASHATVDLALAWAESLRPGVRPRLMELYHEVRARADGPSRGSVKIAHAGSRPDSASAAKLARR